MAIRIPAKFTALAPLVMGWFIRDFPGLDMSDAAAIVGNFGYETAGFTKYQEMKPVVKGSRGGYGWAQWTGPRRRAYEAWCKAQRLDPASDEANYGFAVHELRGPERKAIPALKAASGLKAKTIAFEKAFERAGVKSYAKRLAYAQAAYDAYRAAFTPPTNPKPLGKSRTVWGGGAAATGAAGAAVAEATQEQPVEPSAADQVDTIAQQIEPFTYWSKYALYGFLALTALGIGIALYARWDDAGRPLPWRRK